MTHEKLLARISNRGEIAFNTLALRAVMELHKPDKEGFCAMNCVEADDSGYAWTQCAYPCPTIQAIEEELGL